MARRRVSDEAVVEALRQVLYDYGVINSQTKLKHLVNEAIDQRLQEEGPEPLLTETAKEEREAQREVGEPPAAEEASKAPDTVELMGVTGARVRKLAIASDFVRISVHTREEGAIESLERCPVCDAPMEPIKNKTLYNWVVVLEFSCSRCPYWTPKDQRRLPIRYVFSLIHDERKPQIDFFELDDREELTAGQ